MRLRTRLAALERKHVSGLPPPGPLWDYWEDGTRYDIFDISLEDGGPGIDSTDNEVLHNEGTLTTT